MSALRIVFTAINTTTVFLRFPKKASLAAYEARTKRGGHGMRQHEQPHKRWVVRVGVRRWHLKNPSFDHSITFTALVQPREGEEGGMGWLAPFLRLSAFLPGNFLPAHSCVITGSGAPSVVPGGRRDLVCPPRRRPLMTRGSRRSRSVGRLVCAVRHFFLLSVKSD